MSKHPLEEILHPRSIAVIGASGNKNVPGYQFTASLLIYGFKGKVYPVNPKYTEIAGLKAYPDIRDIPDTVDYVISCVPASQVLNLVKGCVRKEVKALHLFTARFSETGRKDAAELEREILREAQKGGVRIIGPNCMGLYYPDMGISFSDAMPQKSGSVGLVSQSGQLAEELGRYAAMRGVYFSKAISYGNALDLNECDFLDYLARDPETRVILMYVEGVRDGKRFFSSLCNAASTKPVIILKGGRGQSGTRAAASHTASLAGSQKVLDALVVQAGAVSARNFEEMIDLAAAFNFLPPVSGFNVGVAGGGGGASVLAADQCEESGLEVIPLPQEIRDELKSKGSGIWDWIGNPADMSIRDNRDFGPGNILELMAANDNFHLLIAIMSDPHHERQKGT
ncbi:MAG: CoA-binding protein, partial [Deltaproteobacteria bacterium]|nr:CoA-binding protein [Deltaproteobacteria bacterium]